MKNIFIAMTVLLFLLAVNGAAQTIIPISSFEDLCKIGNSSDFPLDGHYELTGDIDASASRDMNDGLGFEPVSMFTGTFNGKGFTISGLYINRPGRDYVGLFGYLYGKVSAVHVAADSIIGNNNVGAIAGYATNAVIIEDCSSSGVVESRFHYVGGLVGSNYGKIISCNSSAIVRGSNYIGGLAGQNTNYDYTEITMSYFTGSVTGFQYVGGLAGSNGGTINQSYSRGSVAGRNDVGGLVGINWSIIMQSYSSGSVAAATAGLTVSNMGGFVGESAGSSKITQCYWDVAASGQAQSKGGEGVIGKTTEEMKKQAAYEEWSFNCVWAIDEDNDYPALKIGSCSVLRYTAGSDGFIGGVSVQMLPQGSTGTPVMAIARSDYYFVRWSDGSIENPRVDIGSNSDREIKAEFAVDRYPYTIKISTFEDLCKIGHDSDYPLSGNYHIVNDIDAADSRNMNDGEGFKPIASFSGIVYGDGKTVKGLYINRPNDSYVSLFSYLNGAKIYDLNVEADTIIGRSNVGGIVGSAWFYTNQRVSEITRSSFKGTVIGGSGVGGIAGELDSHSRITECHSAGIVRGNSSIGGIVGTTNGYVTRCYSTGAVIGSTGSTGGLVGTMYEFGRINESYSTAEVSGGNSVGGLVGFGERTNVYITNSFFAGTVNGGLGGMIAGYGTVTNSYSLGTVTGTSHANFTGCYFDKDVAGSEALIRGIGKTTAEMKTQATFIDWDFDSLWTMVEGVTYPYLKNLPSPYSTTVSVFKDGKLSGNAVSSIPRFTVRGRILNVNAAAGSNLQIRVVDMRGKTLVKFKTVGSGSFSLKRIPVGRYIVDITENGKRVNSSAIVLMK